MRIRSAPPRGFSLPELLAVLLVLGLVAALAVPAFGEISSQLSLRAACADVAAIFNKARMHAAFERRDTGVKWISAGGDVVLTIYEDGNGNGVLSADIRSGVDRRVAGPFSMKGKHPGVTFSFVPRFSGPDPGGAAIGDLSDPIRFGRSDICSFSPLGHSSPGSVYLSNGRSRQAVVRVGPMSSTIQILEWESGAKAWRKRW